MRRVAAIWMGFLLLVCGFAQAKGFDPERDVAVVYRKGAVVLTVPPGVHLKASFMEVVLQKGAPGTLKVGPLPPTKDKDELGEGIWHDRVAIPVSGTGLKGEVPLVVTYQPCAEGEGGVCYPPTDRILKVKAAEIPSADAGEAKAPQPAAAAPKPGPALAAAPVQAPAQAPPPPAPAQDNLLLVFLGVFAAGLLASLTPCVFPMIPITMAVIGAKGGGKARGFGLSLALVLGMAATYTTLGVLAARTGAAFGAFAQRPAFLIPVAAIFALLALSLFGAFELALPDAFQQKLQGGQRKGFAGAFVVGLVLGPLSAPCVGPVIGTVLLAIALKGNVWLGAAELFTFALGMGVLFLAVGTFSATLPRSGEWMIRFKRIMGLVVLGFAIWTLRLVVPDWVLFALTAILQLIGAAVFGLFEPAEGFLGQIRKAFAILLLVLGILHGLQASQSFFKFSLLPAGPTQAAKAEGPQGWLAQDYEGALAKAAADHKLVLVDTYAEWCAECKELDDKTWTDPQVAAWIKDQAVPVRIDTDKVRKDLQPKLGIRSYPTVLILDGQGRELRRSTGFLKPTTMLAFLQGR